MAIGADRWTEMLCVIFIGAAGGRGTSLYSQTRVSANRGPRFPGTTEGGLPNERSAPAPGGRGL